MKIRTLAASALMSMSSLLPAAYAQQVPGPGYWQITDTDEDGIPDELERALIDRYRPVYRYDNDESHWPSSCTWQAAQSELRRNDHILFSHAEMLANPGLALEGHLRWAGGNNPYLPSTMETHATFEDFRLNIYNWARRGQWFYEGGDPSVLGIYAWCQVVRTPPNYHGSGNLDFGGEGLPYVMIQYWQFFSYNDAYGPDGGDHEGDWLFLDVFAKPRGDPQDVNTYDLIGLVYHHHGDSSCNPSTHWGGELPADDIPVCILEEDSHEWHINTCHNCCGTLNDADGDGLVYRVNNVTNLGAKFAIMDVPTDTAATRLDRRLALFYNGRWGRYAEISVTAPAGPTIDERSQYVGAWTDPVRPLWVGYINDDGPVDPYNNSVGTRYYPYHTLTEALAQFTGVRDFSKVRIAAGVYSEPPTPGQTVLRLNRPMRIEAWGAGAAYIRLQ